MDCNMTELLPWYVQVCRLIMLLRTSLSSTVPSKMTQESTQVLEAILQDTNLYDPRSEKERKGVGTEVI